MLYYKSLSEEKFKWPKVFAYLTEEEKVDAIDTFFVKVREELDIIPAQVRVLEYMQEKATFKTQDGGRTIKVAQLIKHPILLEFRHENIDRGEALLDTALVDTFLSDKGYQLVD